MFTYLLNDVARIMLHVSNTDLNKRARARARHTRDGRLFKSVLDTCNMATFSFRVSVMAAVHVFTWFVPVLLDSHMASSPSGTPNGPVAYHW